MEQLDEKEIEYIALYDSYNNGYNSTKGGDGRIINKIDHEEELLQLAKSGMCAQELADKFGVNKATVFRTLHKLGFYYHADPDDVIRLADEGKTYQEIADLLGCHKASVMRKLHQRGIRRRRVRIDKRTDFDFDGMFFDIENGTPVNEISQKYDISESSIHRICASAGIKLQNAKTQANQIPMDFNNHLM